MDEIERLKTKCNSQLDYIRELKQQLIEKSTDAPLKTAEITAFNLSVSLFEKAVLESDPAAKVKKSYVSIDYPAVLGVLEPKCEKIGISAAKIVQQWAELGLIIKDSRGKCTFSRQSKDFGSSRCLHVSIAVFELIKEKITWSEPI